MHSTYNQTRCCYRLAALIAALICGLNAPNAQAVEGTEFNATGGIWAPLLPNLQAGALNDSGDSVGGIVGLSGHHRFDGYRTSVECNVTYCVTDSVEMIGFDGLLRDTWVFDFGDLSAGFGYSQMDWEQSIATHNLESTYQGAKIIFGWEGAFGRRPLWVDLSIGLYDLDGTYVGLPVTANTSKFTTTYGLKVKHDCELFGVPARAIFGFDYLSDITTWQGGQIGTDDACALTGAIEFHLF